MELIPRALLALFMYQKYRCSLSKRTGIYYVDSSRLEACHPKRVHQNKVMKGIAGWGKSSMGWFYGFKYHLVVNNLGEIMNVYLSSGNKADNNVKILFYLTNNLSGALFGDRGYLLNEEKKAFIQKNNKLCIFTKRRKNMKKKDFPLQAKLWLAKRGIVESVINIHKSSCDIWHTRHRSPVNAFAHFIAGICAYSFFQRKPSTNINMEKNLLPQAPQKMLEAA